MKASIPATMGIADRQTRDVLDPLKAIVDEITGQNPRKPKIARLGPTATLPGVINKINEIIDRLQE